MQLPYLPDAAIYALVQGANRQADMREHYAALIDPPDPNCACGAYCTRPDCTYQELGEDA